MKPFTCNMLTHSVGWVWAKPKGNSLYDLTFFPPPTFSGYRIPACFCCYIHIYKEKALTETAGVIGKGTALLLGLEFGQDAYAHPAVQSPMEHFMSLHS